MTDTWTHYVKLGSFGSMLTSLTFSGTTPPFTNTATIDPLQVAQDGRQAIDYLKGTGAYADRAQFPLPGLVLLDLKLPKVDGLEVLRAIKSDPRTQAVPVVIMTASKEERDVVSSYKLGVNAYIQKPVDFDQFRQIVEQVGLFWLVVNQPAPAAAFATT